ncbi:hypothetical protein [Ferroacidibacillus organovorans]|uniref:Uncharacterized protein n=1 Tax=Ferroacidibacillus organovorans TaxID=1765683 RepID=A0A101XTZ6_9BACL|nr:hypothetical protein [Ferroacidibacillus organovorans]KUO97461.1 hypothetical protein ATW55_06260 [Ferroacidibacillus organovorans]KUO97483.1 hypothetical protein ATW55_06385 [Ferroacidibacillus organovorans]
MLMNKIIVLLSNPSWDSVIISFLTALFTAAYVVLTRRLVIGSKAAFFVAHIVPGAEDNFNSLFLEFTNPTGNLLRDLTLIFNPDCMLITKKTLGELFGKMTVLLPGERVRCYLVSAVDRTRIEEMFPDGQLVIKALWHDSARKKAQSQKLVLKIDQFIGLPISNGQDKIAEAISAATEALLITSAFSNESREAMTNQRRTIDMRDLPLKLVWFKTSEGWKKIMPMRLIYLNKQRILQPVTSVGDLGPAGFQHPILSKGRIYVFFDNCLHIERDLRTTNPRGIKAYICIDGTTYVCRVSGSTSIVNLSSDGLSTGRWVLDVEDEKTAQKDER